MIRTAHSTRKKISLTGFAPYVFTFLFLQSLTLFSCQTVREPKEVYSTPDYTVEDIKQNEIKQIEKLSEEFPVEALWRAYLLGDSDTVKRYEDNLLSLFGKAESEKDYLTMNKYYTSLSAFYSLSGVKENETFKSIDKKLLVSKFIEGVPGLSLTEKDKSLLPHTLADCINATVTVWVDKGIKIERGAGYADRVIGSGFFISSLGYIVTNNHVINDVVDPKHEGYTRLFVKLARDSETRIPARVVGYDPTIDLALLKAEVDPPFILALGEKSDLSIGEPVQAIGTPLGLHGTITSGIVSAVDRKLFTTGSVLQIDAAVNSGNSGGPCIDYNMRVQAIVFAGILRYQGLNFAIPVEYLRQDLPYLFSPETHSSDDKRHSSITSIKRKHSWLSSFGHTNKEGLLDRGLLVQYVMSGGVLFRAGLEKGDVITALDGKKVNTLEDMQDILRSFTTETLLKLDYTRNEVSQSALVYLAERPEEPGYEMYQHDLIANSFIPIFGMGLSSISSYTYLRKYVVNEVVLGSVADESGFSVGDPVTILEVKFNAENTLIMSNIGTRRKKKGFLDVVITLGSELDGPYYF